jgi:hypothetical protein
MRFELHRTHVWKEGTMSYARLLSGAALISLLVCACVGFHIPAPATAAEQAVAADRSDLSAQRRGGGARRAAAGGGGAAMRRSAVPGGGAAVRRTTTTVGRGTVVRSGAGVATTRAVVRPVRSWTHRPYYGTVIGGVVLGTVIAATAAGVAPAAPGPNMCWFWADASQTQGYWDYCTPPQ